MLINTTPTARSFGKTPAGPCVSSDRLRAGAEALGVAFHLDADGVQLDGVRYASLSDADAYLAEVAETRQLGAWLSAAQTGVEEQATQARRDAQVIAVQREAPIANAQREALQVLGFE